MSARLFLLFYFVFSLSIVHAGGAPETTVVHESPPYFASNSRLFLEAQIDDPKGINEVRCYFKDGIAGSYLYVPMDSGAEGKYQCFLPSFNGLGVLEYFFLIVNDRGQMIRSASYSVQEIPGEVRSNSSIIRVSSELGDKLWDDSWIADERIEFVAVRDPGKLYGLRAGLYRSDEIPESINYMTGYFGGFMIDSASGRLNAVKGFAINAGKASFSGSGSGIIVKTSEVVSKTSNCPDVEGDGWIGYFARTDNDDREELTATIIQTDCNVSIITTLSGLGHYLIGHMTSEGDMLLYDQYDGEDWTTHAGPANSSEVAIYDYIYPPQVGEPPPPLNKIALYRVPPAPTGVEASDGDSIAFGIAVSWKLTPGASSYKVYTCKNTTSDNCTELAVTSVNHYSDTSPLIGVIVYRVQGCNKYGCGELSDYGTGYSSLSSIAPVYRLLL